MTLMFRSLEIYYVLSWLDTGSSIGKVADLPYGIVIPV